jgi:PST family polysaccharide transporter
MGAATNLKSHAFSTASDVIAPLGPAPATEVLAVPRETREDATRFPGARSTEHINRESVRGGVIMLATQGMRFFVQIASTMVFARLLTPHDFGYVAMVTAITGFVALFQDANLSTVTVQRAQITHAEVSTLFWINVALSVTVMAVVAALAPAIAWFYHEPRLVWITLTLAGTFVFGGLSAQHQALLRRDMQFKKLAAADVFSMLLGFVIGLVMAKAGFGYWALVGASFTTAFVNCAVIWIVCAWRPTLPTRTTEVRSLVAFGGRLTGFQVLVHFTRNFDNVVIGRALGSVALGIYSKAYALLALPINQVNTPLSSVVIPALSRLQNEPKEYARFYLRALRSLSFLTLPLVVFSAIFAHDVVRVLLGEQWLRAAFVFQLLAPAALVGAINVAPGWLCISLDRSKQQLIYGCVSAPVCVVAFLVGVKWGMEGVAAGFSLTYTLLFWLFVLYATKGSPVKFSEVFGAFAMPLFASTAIGLTVWMWRWDFLANAAPALTLGASAVVFTAGYLLLAVMFTQTRALANDALQAVCVHFVPNQGRS